MKLENCFEPSILCLAKHNMRISKQRMIDGPTLTYDIKPPFSLTVPYMLSKNVCESLLLTFDAKPQFFKVLFLIQINK